MSEAIRTIKVCEQSGYKYRPTPIIQLKGRWLKDFGFDAGTQVQIECEDGRLVITKMETMEDSPEGEGRNAQTPTEKDYRKTITPNDRAPRAAEGRRHYGRKVTYGGKRI